MQAGESSEFTAEQVLALMRRRWRFILAVVTSSTLASVAYALLTPPVYRSEALLQPRQENHGAGPLALLDANLGSLGDLGLGPAASGDRAVALAVLKSRILVEPFLVERGVLQKLYAPVWDAEAGRWTVDRPPTPWQAYNDFTRDNFSVIPDKKSGLVTVAIEWTDPQEAQVWVTDLIQRANAFLRARAIEEGEKNLTYLREQAVTIGQVELRQALYGLVESELKKLMLARGSEEFAFKTIDPAVVPQKRIRPKRKLIVLMGSAGGFVLSLLLVLLMHATEINRSRA